MIFEAWDLVPESALKGIWNKLLIQRKQPNDFKPELTGTINDIVQMGQILGIENIDATNVKELLKLILIHCQMKSSLNWIMN